MCAKITLTQPSETTLEESVLGMPAIMPVCSARGTRILVVLTHLGKLGARFNSLPGRAIAFLRRGQGGESHGRDIAKKTIS